MRRFRPGPLPPANLLPRRTLAPPQPDTTTDLPSAPHQPIPPAIKRLPGPHRPPLHRPNPQSRPSAPSSTAQPSSRIDASAAAALALGISAPSPSVGGNRAYSVMYGKSQRNRKHKKFDGDGILIVRGREATLLDTSGKKLGATRLGSDVVTTFGPESSLYVGQRELEVIQEIEWAKYESGAAFTEASGATMTVAASPLKKRPPGIRSSPPTGATPLHNPNAEGAYILHKAKRATDVPVVLDPYLRKVMRPHQLSGVQFMYDCIVGSQGCILADEMGLGKTLQSIALVWTVLNQGITGKPLANKAMIVCPSTLVQNWKKEFRKWLGRQRLEPTVIADCTPEAAKEMIRVFSTQRPGGVLIISYDLFRMHGDQMQSLSVGLLICDEGHRLKNTAIQTTRALAGMSVKRRIILSGTPIQNDLDELYALSEFVNPGMLGGSAGFKHVYTQPIMRSQEPKCSDEEKRIGEARSAELSRLINSFVLRRTNETISQFLPVKSELVLFCPLNPSQATLYTRILESGGVNSYFTGRPVFSEALKYIILLRKLCNATGLLWKMAQEGADADGGDVSLVSSICEDQPDWKQNVSQQGSKLLLLASLLRQIRTNTKDRVVVCSNFTQTLDVLEVLLKDEGYPYLRMDGSTAVSKRQPMVDQFNQPNVDVFVFLLSTRAGGLGLNLVRLVCVWSSAQIGGNRLVLYDPDWNPAVDLQAMARVHREGQRKPVFIYRLITTGTIEEKMYQRQIKKMAVAGNVVDEQEATKDFSTEDLRDLFTLRTDTLCDTHDLIGCKCAEDASKAVLSEAAEASHQASKRKFLKTPRKRRIDGLNAGELSVWEHHTDVGSAPCPMLAKCVDAKVSMVFSVTRDPNGEDSRKKSVLVDDSDDDEIGVVPKKARVEAKVLDDSDDDEIGVVPKKARVEAKVLDDSDDDEISVVPKKARVEAKVLDDIDETDLLAILGEA